MRRRTRTAWGLVAIVVGSLPTEAVGDWLVQTDGQRSEVQAFEIGARSVAAITLNGKPWSVFIGAIDVPATRAANGMGPEELLSPSWPRPAAAAPRPSAQAPPPPPPPRPLPPPEPRPEPAPRQRVTPPPAPPPPPERVRRPSFPARPDRPSTRVAVFINGIAGAEPLAFGESRTFERFSESASFDARYEEATRPGYELGALVRLKGPFAVVASAELFEPSPRARFRAVVPHPFFYDRPRELSGERSDLFRRELAVHIDPAITFDLGSRITVDLFSGVSLFFTETDVLEDVVFEETFPFEALVDGGTLVRRIEDRPIGFNVGTSVTLRLASVFGVDFGVRYSRAEARLRLDDDRELVFDAGGLRVGAGLRFLFP